LKCLFLFYVVYLFIKSDSNKPVLYRRASDQSNNRINQYLFQTTTRSITAEFIRDHSCPFGAPFALSQEFSQFRIQRTASQPFRHDLSLRINQHMIRDLAEMIKINHWCAPVLKIAYLRPR
jgi:hypothetical protein